MILSPLVPGVTAEEDGPHFLTARLARRPPAGQHESVLAVAPAIADRYAHQSDEVIDLIDWMLSKQDQLSLAKLTDAELPFAFVDVRHALEAERGGCFERADVYEERIALVEQLIGSLEAVLDVVVPATSVKQVSGGAIVKDLGVVAQDRAAKFVVDVAVAESNVERRLGFIEINKEPQHNALTLGGSRQVGVVYSGRFGQLVQLECLRQLAGLKGLIGFVQRMVEVRAYSNHEITVLSMGSNWERAWEIL